jgi:hypothetical protein
MYRRSVVPVAATSSLVGYNPAQAGWLSVPDGDGAPAERPQGSVARSPVHGVRTGRDYDTYMGRNG